MEIRAEKIISVVSPKLGARIVDFKTKLAALNSGYSSVAEWQPSAPADYGTFPQAQFEVSEIYHGDASSFAYNHHQAISKFKDQLVASWSASPVDEDRPGQEVHYATSPDGKKWTKYRVLVATDPKSSIVRNNAGLCAHDGKLYAYVGVAGEIKPSTDPNLTSFVPEYIRLDVYVTKDLVTWEEHQGIADNVYIFEGPRSLKDGSHLCAGCALIGEQYPLALRWKPGQDMASSPQIVHVPWTDRRIRPLQGTWYQTDDGHVWMYFRDAGMSTRLALSWSDDNGQTWADLVLTDMPNSMARANAGRLHDGRYYLIGNNYDRLLDRSHFQIALSDDGLTFDRMYTLVEGKTHRRVDGLHKEDGWHYPNSIVDGNKLCVIFSVNKEDICCGVTDVTLMA